MYNTTITHTDINYGKNRDTMFLLKEVTESIKIRLLGNEFQSLVELTKKELKYDTVLAKGCSKHLE